MAAKNKIKFVLTPKLKEKAPDLVIYEIQAFYHALKTWGLNWSNNLPWIRVALNNSCLDTTLVHARTLLDFFEVQPNNRYEDDILSMDMGFPAKRILGSVTLRRMINKRLAHLTYTRSKFNESSKKPWDMKAFRCLVRRCEKFTTTKVVNDLIKAHAKPDKQNAWDILKKELKTFMT